MSTTYFVHAAETAGVAMMKASRATIDEALKEAELELNSGAAFVWIVDGQGNLVLPPSQIKARLDQLASAPRGSAR
jgi:hypothetical protein